MSGKAGRPSGPLILVEGGTPARLDKRGMVQGLGMNRSPGGALMPKA